MVSGRDPSCTKPCAHLFEEFVPHPSRGLFETLAATTEGWNWAPIELPVDSEARGIRSCELGALDRGAVERVIEVSGDELGGRVELAGDRDQA